MAFNFGDLTSLKPAGFTTTETKPQKTTYAANTNNDVSIHDEVKSEEKKTPDFSEQEVNDVLDMLDKMSEAEVQAVLEQLDEYQDGYEEEDDSVSSDKVDKAMEQIEAKKQALKEKGEEALAKGEANEMQVKIGTQNQFVRQEIYVDALKDLSVEELEEFIKEYGTEEFAKEILGTLCWQATRGDDKEYKAALDALREMIDNEIDPELRDELFEGSPNYKRAKEQSDALQEEKGIDANIYYL